MATQDRVEVEIVIDDKLDAGLAKSRAKLENFRQQIVIEQQQIAGLAAQQSTDVFKNVAGQISRFSAQQKAQLSFQVNDVLTGLASGQNPLQILAQQSGQIVQIFQQAKLSQEGVAVATTAAAASETAFATSAKAAAVSQAQVAVSSEATAAAMGQASVSATALGASVVSLGAILAAGLVTILAVWKAVSDISEAAQKRLKTEQDVTAEWNKQHAVLGDIQKMLAEASKERSFGTFVQDASLSSLNAARNDIQAQLNASQQAVTDEMERRQLLLAQNPGLGPSYVAGASGTPEESKKREELQKRLGDQLKQIDAQIYNERQRLNADHNKNVIEGAMRTAASVRDADAKAAVDAAKASIEAQKKYEQERKKMLEESLRKAKEWVEYVKNARSTVAETFASSTNNPFVRIWSDSEKAIERVVQATGRIKGGLADTLTQLIRNKTAAQEFGQSLANALKAASLRTDASNIAQGSVEEEARRRLFPNYFTQAGREAHFQNEVKRITEERARRQLEEQFQIINQGRSPSESAEITRQRNQAIIAATQGLTGNQLGRFKTDAINARLDEARAAESEKKEAKDLKEREVKVLEKLEKRLEAGKSLEITIDDPSNRTTAGSSGDVNHRYNNR